MEAASAVALPFCIHPLWGNAHIVPMAPTTRDGSRKKPARAGGIKVVLYVQSSVLQISCASASKCVKERSRRGSVAEDALSKSVHRLFRRTKVGDEGVTESI